MLDRHRQHALCKKKLLPIQLLQGTFGPHRSQVSSEPEALKGVSVLNLDHNAANRCKESWRKKLDLNPAHLNLEYNCQWQTTTVFVALNFELLKCKKRLRPSTTYKLPTYKIIIQYAKKQLSHSM